MSGGLCLLGLRLKINFPYREPNLVFYLLDFQQTWSERIFRYIILNWLPKSIMFKQIVKDSAYRPQANFLPQAPKRGTAPVILQKPSKRIQDEKDIAKKSTASPVAV
jgi:hypothetical protein